MKPASPATRVAIRCIRPELVAASDRERIEQEMTDLGVRLGRAVDVTTVEIDPTREGPYTTVRLALRRTGADAVIVHDLEHVDGIDDWIRQHAELITLKGEKVLERAATTAASA